MMTEPPKASGGDEMCPICNKPKSRHTPEEMLGCSRKIKEYQDAKEEQPKE
ncbi:MAG: hypothetical protein ACE5EJ_06265 [Nitrosopumilaceae archaeon]